MMVASEKGKELIDTYEYSHRKVDYKHTLKKTDSAASEKEEEEEGEECQNVTQKCFIYGSTVTFLILVSSMFRY